MAKPVRIVDVSGDEARLIIGGNPAYETLNTSGTFLMTLDPSAEFRLLRFDLAVVAPGITASEVLNVGVDAGDGAPYDHIIHTEDFTGVSSLTSLVVPFGSNYTYEADDKITVSCPNSLGLSMAARLAYELL